MPNVLASIPAAQRDEIAEALTHFLIAQSIRKFQTDESQTVETDLGKELYHSVGCVACHAPHEEKARQLTPEEVARWDDQDDEEQLDGVGGIGRVAVFRARHCPG